MPAPSLKCALCVLLEEHMLLDPAKASSLVRSRGHHAVGLAAVCVSSCSLNNWEMFSSIRNCVLGMPRTLGTCGGPSPLAPCRALCLTYPTETDVESRALKIAKSWQMPGLLAHTPVHRWLEFSNQITWQAISLSCSGTPSKPWDSQIDITY